MRQPDRSPSSTTALYALAAVLVVSSLIWLQFRSDPADAPSQVNDGAAPDTLPTNVLPVRLDDVKTYRGPRYGLPGHQATKDKSQTKLWRAAGSWWAVMVNGASSATHIHEWTAQRRWRDTGVVVDGRADSLGDAVWNGRNLYIASRTSGGALTLARFRLVTGGAGPRWVPLAPAPVLIAGGGSSSLSIDVDSRNRVWAVYNQAGRMWLAHSSEGGASFATPRPLPRPNRVQPDDSGAVTATSGSIAVMWSDQIEGSFRFAIRRDTEPLGRLEVSTPPVKGLRQADGHVRLLAMRDGRLLAAVKTSLGDELEDPPRSPLLMLLVRTTGGRWTQHVVATTADQMTRPQIVLNEDETQLFFFATSPQGGGEIYAKAADTESLVFGPGRGTPILGASGGDVNDATVARARVTDASDLLVLASNAAAAVYHTAVIPIGAP
ncbi:MAG: hypothetical protein WB441_02390 [Nocardioidaceae bacterium]